MHQTQPETPSKTPKPQSKPPTDLCYRVLESRESLDTYVHNIQSIYAELTSTTFPSTLHIKLKLHPSNVLSALEAMEAYKEAMKPMVDNARDALGRWKDAVNRLDRCVVGRSWSEGKKGVDEMMEFMDRVERETGLKGDELREFIKSWDSGKGWRE